MCLPNRGNSTADTDGERGDGVGAVVATSEHPFWSPDQRAWVEAGDLSAGSWPRTSAGTYVQVSAIAKSSSSGQRVHNLDVAGFSTYHVAVGGADALVHNNDLCGIDNLAHGKMLYHTIDTPQGKIEMLARVSIENGQVTLSDIAIFGTTGDTARGSLGTGGTGLLLREVRKVLLPALGAQGFKSPRIRGVRVTGPVGHRPDLEFKVPGADS